MANTYRAITSPTAESFEYQFSERDGNLKVCSPSTLTVKGVLQLPLVAALLTYCLYETITLSCADHAVHHQMAAAWNDREGEGRHSFSIM